MNSFKVQDRSSNIVSCQGKFFQVYLTIYTYVPIILIGQKWLRLAMYLPMLSLVQMYSRIKLANILGSQPVYISAWKVWESNNFPTQITHVGHGLPIVGQWLPLLGYQGTQLLTIEFQGGIVDHKTHFPTIKLYQSQRAPSECIKCSVRNWVATSNLAEMKFSIIHYLTSYILDKFNSSFPRPLLQTSLI